MSWHQLDDRYCLPVRTIKKRKMVPRNGSQSLYPAHLSDRPLIYQINPCFASLAPSTHDRHPENVSIDLLRCKRRRMQRRLHVVHAVVPSKPHNRLLFANRRACPLCGTLLERQRSTGSIQTSSKTLKCIMSADVLLDCFFHVNSVIDIYVSLFLRCSR